MAIEAVVADTGPLVALARVDGLALLSNLFATVWVTPEIVDECLAKPDRPDAITIASALERGCLRCEPAPGRIASAEGLGAGEASAIALALRHDAMLLVDDRVARRAAKELGLRTLGSLGVLIALKRGGHVQAIRPALSTLLDSGYFLSGAIIQEALRLAGEEFEP